MKEITLNHICKIEGHANLTLKIENNQVVRCELEAVEGARFFEALVLGKKLEDIQEIVSRICGICSCSHSVACNQALEEALGIKPSERQKIIREILMLGERIRSHATHLYFLALPDYLGLNSALELSNKNKDKLDDAILLISLGNKIIESIGGREIHPFFKMEQKTEGKDYTEVAKKLENAREVARRTVKLFLKLDYPKMERETDYLSLHENSGYAVISGKIKSNSGLIEDDDYKKHLRENVKEYATSKFALKDGKMYQVGAMARMSNNLGQLDSESREFLKGVKTWKNPFHNNIAQAVEILHAVSRTAVLFRRLNDAEDRNQEIKIKAGRGVSAVEAPRGTLFHEYEIDKEGKIIYCNIITPTVQNLNIMEQDIRNLVNSLLAKNSGKEKIVSDVEKLIRAYDPCFSCSTHFLRVNWE